MIVKFRTYWNTDMIVKALETSFDLLEVKTTRTDDNTHEMAVKAEYLIRTYCHQLFNRSIYTRETTGDLWIEQHLIDVCTHNPVDIVAGLEAMRSLDIEYGKTHQQTSAMNYRETNPAKPNNPILSSDVSAYNEQQNLAMAFTLFQGKNFVLDKIYADLELICMPFRWEDDEEVLG